MNPTMMQERPCYIRFETVAAEDRSASIEAGRTMYRDVDMVHVTPHGGSLTNEAVAEEWLRRKEDLGDPHARAYREAYGYWKKGQEPPENGTALKLVPTFSPGEIRSLAGVDVRSVEDLAAWPDGRLGALGMGGLRLREKARAYLEAANNHGKVAERVAALEVAVKDKDTRIASLEAQIKALEGEIGASAVARARKVA